jgi:hypothetical protein
MKNLKKLTNEVLEICNCGSEDFVGQAVMGLVTLTPTDTPLFDLFSPQSRLIGENGNRRPEMFLQKGTFRHFALAQAMTAIATTMFVDPALQEYISNGAEFNIEGEIVKVTSRVGSTNEFNVVRGVGDTVSIITVAAHPATTLAYYVGTPLKGGCKDLKCSAIEGLKVENTLVEIGECYCVNERDQRNPDLLSDGNPVLNEKIDKTSKILDQLDYRAVYGNFKYTSKCEDNTTGGLRWFIRNYQGIIVDVPAFVTSGKYASAQLTNNMIRDAFLKISETPNATPNIMLMNPATWEYITRTMAGSCMSNCNGTTGGVIGSQYNKFIDPVSGRMLDVVLSYKIEKDEIYFVNTSDLKKYYGRNKDGRPYFLVDAADVTNCGESGTLKAEVMYRVDKPYNQALLQGFTTPL